MLSIRFYAISASHDLVHKYLTLKLDKLSSKFVCTSVMKMLTFPPKYESFRLPAPR